MKGIGKSLKFAALAAIMLVSTSSGAVTSSTINYRIHYITENGNAEPGFPYPYVGYTDYYCDGSDITYGLVTGNQQYQYVGSC